MFHGHTQPRTSCSGVPDDPDAPARLIKQLEITGPGCRWLLDRWAELRARLEAGECWQSPEKLKAIRLLGRQPLDAADVREVTEIFLACNVLDPRYNHAFHELRCELDEDEFKQYDKRLRGRNLDAMRPAEPAAARATLLGLVDRAVERLSALAEAHRIRDDMTAARRRELLAFDDSPQGERLRRHAMTSDRGLHRALAAMLKLRKDRETPEFDILRLVEANLGAEARAERFSQNEPTIADDDAFQNEATADIAGQAHPIEPTGENLTPDPQDQPAADFRNLANEPGHDVEPDLQNEATLNDRDRHGERGAGIVDETPADRPLERFQMISRSTGALEENRGNANEHHQERDRPDNHTLC